MNSFSELPSCSDSQSGFLTAVIRHLGQSIRMALSHPETRGLSLDDPRTTERRKLVILGNSFLKRLYHEWYSTLLDRIPKGPGKVLELGSGAGFLSQYVPEAITSEVFACKNVRAILDGRQLPFSASSLKAIVMVDVMHHIPEIRPFLSESARCLRSGGSVLMIEPWVSTWSRIVYSNVHHEPFQPEAKSWGFPSIGPLSGANGALPWIVFERDRRMFEKEFPELEIQSVQPIMPFRYLVSGGVSMRQLMPGALFGLWKALDEFLARWPSSWPMFAIIELRRQ